MSAISIYIDKAKNLKSRALSIWAHAGFQKYFRNTGWMLGTKILSMLISLLTIIFIARSLGPSNFGELSYAISFVGIFSFIASLGIDNILYRELIKNPGKSEVILGTSFFIKLFAGILTTILVIIFAFYFSQDDVSKIIIYILSGTFIFNAFHIISFEFQAKVKSKFPSVASLIIVIILNTLKILVIFNEKGVIYLSTILLLESILYALFYCFLYETKTKNSILRWRFDKKIAFKLLLDSWPLIFSSAFALLYSRIDQVFIKNIIDAQAVGVYDAAVRIAEAWYFIPSLIIVSLFPAIINAKITSEKNYEDRLKKLALLLIIISVLTASLTTLFAPFIIKTLYGNSFMDGTAVLQIYVWSGIAIALGNLANNYLITENYRKILFFTYFISMLINVILNLIWIPKYGIVGSAYATLLSYSIGPVSLLIFKKTRNQIISIFYAKKQ